MSRKRTNILLITYSVIISLLVNMNIAKPIPHDVEQQVMGGDYSNHLLYVFSKILYSLIQIDVVSFFIVTFLVMYMIKYVHNSTSNNFLTKLLNSLVAIVLSVYLVFGKLFKNDVSDKLFNSRTGILLMLLNIFGITLFLSLCFLSLEKYIKYYLKSSNIDIRENKNYNFNWKKEFSAIMLCWIPYMIILYPGVCSWDTINQLHEFFGHGPEIFDIYPIGHYLISKNTFTISNQHNFFVTLFYGFNFKIGYYLFHNTNIGLFISALIQSIAYIGVLTYSLLVFKRLGMRAKVIHVFKRIYAFFPVFPILSLFLVKNVFYSIFLLWFILLLTEVFNDKKIANSKYWQAGLWLSILFQLITEKYAVYIVVLLGIIFAFSLKGQLRRIMLTGMIIPICLFVAVEGMIFSRLNVSNGDPIEGKAMMIQQTALYVKKYPNDLTSHQDRVINEVFVKKNLSKIYNPGWADPVKSSGEKYPHFLEGYRYKTVTRSEMKQYNKVWLQMFKQHPLVYLEAFLNESYGYLDSNYTVANSSAINQNDSLPLSHTEFQVKIGNRLISAGEPHHCLRLRKFLATFYNVFHQLLPTSLILNGNIFVISTLLVFLLLTSLKLYETLLIIIPLIMQIPVLLLSPVNGSQRYMYPFVIAFIVVDGIVFTVIRKKLKQHN